MNITTIIELENREVENMAGAKLVFAQELVDEHIVETCVECFQEEDSEQKISTEDAMDRVFNQLKEEGVIPKKVEEYSYEMPSCGQLRKNTDTSFEIPQNVIISFMS
ncbi:hypothetical protein D1B31_22675 [Neobacillus notoginsengisoli]|uniref:Uncharacterized protein n=1 Tax=Neobacillus notoginsengisoli TaxID=1578198 RepID=A0A417YEW6_9BACI|nr:hypothetical protein [Neobacillus notoginsengisoli]RHW31192.1 hypothetical protein D1B31_22675 [Neobacillus notoginsengisoli]